MRPGILARVSIESDVFQIAITLGHALLKLFIVHITDALKEEQGEDVLLVGGGRYRVGLRPRGISLVIFGS